MNWIQAVAQKIRALSRKTTLDTEMDEEMRSHVELRTKQHMAAGLTPEAARVAALRQFGWTDRTKDLCRDQRGVHWIENPLQDFRFGLRQLAKNPGFAAVVILTLALGIGSASAVYGLIQGVLLSPPPYKQPDRLALVSPARSDGQEYKRGATTGQWSHWREAGKTMETWAAYGWTFNFLVSPEGSESMQGMVVTRDYFKVLGLSPYLGREFVDTDVPAPKSPRTCVMLGYDFWRRRFNSDPRIVGKSLQISRSQAPLTILGVTAPGVRFLPDPGASSEPNYDLNAQVDFWLLAAIDESKPKDGSLNVVARLRDGVSLQEAQADLAAATASQAGDDRDYEGLTARVSSVTDVLNEEGRRLLLPLSGAVALLFLIACGNVAGLLLARGLQRQQEYAVRGALGAGRSRVFRQALTESLVLAVLGGLAGALVAVGLVRLLQHFGGHAVPRLESVTPGWPILAFGIAAALVATAVAGLFPAFRASRSEPANALKGTRSSAGRTERRWLGAVAVFQTALTLALLAGAALLIRTVGNLARVQPGYDTENVLTMTVTTVQGDRYKEFHLSALDQVSHLPGVKYAAFVWGLPLTGNKWGGTMERVGQGEARRLKDQMDLPLRSVTEAYFDAMGIRIVEGRGFRSSDDDTAPGVAVVNQALVDRYFSDVNPIGQRLRFAGETNRGKEIVGIVSNTRTEALNQQAEPEIYFPFWQSGAFSKHLIVRTTAHPRAVIASVRQTVRSVDPTAAVEHVRTMEEIRSDSVASRVFAMRILFGFAIAASFLALVGIYGVLSLSVDSRVQEIAVRVAIGAQRRDIYTLIMGEGFRLIGVGLALGAVAAISLGRILSGLLFDVHPADPLTLLGTALLFSVVAVVAFYLPARRATRVEPMAALRGE